MGDGFLVYDEESKEFRRTSREDVLGDRSTAPRGPRKPPPEHRPISRKPGKGTKRNLMIALLVTIFAFGWLATSLFLMITVEEKTEELNSADIVAGSSAELGEFVDEIESEDRQ